MPGGGDATHSFGGAHWRASVVGLLIAVVPASAQVADDPGTALGAGSGAVEAPEPARLLMRAPAWAIHPSLPITPSHGLHVRHPIRTGASTVAGAVPLRPQSGTYSAGWRSRVGVVLGVAGGAVLGKFIYDQACEGSECQIEHHAVTGTFAAMGGLAAFLLGRGDRIAAPEAPVEFDEIWEQFRRNAVPATPPDTLPMWIYTADNAAPPTRFVARQFVPRIVVVAFHPWASTEHRQRAIDDVDGAVIGGEEVSDGEGLYYLLIRDDRSGRGVRQAVARLAAYREVSVAAPRYVDDR